MPYIKRDTTAKKINSGAQDTAIEAHAGFVRFIVSEVKKQGLSKVVKLKPSEEHYWLKQGLERVLNFAENVQLKQLPNKVEGGGSEGEIVIRIEKGEPSADNLQAPRFAIPNLQ